MQPKKSFGQHFLQDESVLMQIIQAADLPRGASVLEVGPGRGVLTQALLDVDARVTAVEADDDLIPVLQKRFGEAVMLVHSDILSFDRSTVAQPFFVVANIPYNITSDILHTFLTQDPRPERLVLLVQEEVAQRVTAGPPEMSVLSVMCQLYAKCTYICSVPASAFFPPPKVESAVIRLDVYPKTFDEREDIEQVVGLAKLGFASRRKQLHNNLSQAGYGTSADLKEVFVRLGFRPDVRAEQLTVEDWERLFAVIYKV